MICFSRTKISRFAMTRGLFVAAILLLSATSTRAQVSSLDTDAKVLLAGVNEIAAPGIPGSLCVFGKHAQVLVTGENRGAAEAVVAFTRSGAQPNAGRIVAFGHDGYFAPDNLAVGDTKNLLLNAVRWAAPKATTLRVWKKPTLTRWLNEQGVAAQDGTMDDLTGVQLLVLSAHDLTSGDVARVRGFVENGGGLVIAATGWGWQQITGRNIASDFTGNQLLTPYGVAWTTGMLGRTSANGFDAKRAVPALVHAGRAFEAARSHIDNGVPLNAEDAKQISAVLSAAILSLPPGDTQLLPALRALGQGRAGEVIPTHDAPIARDNLAGRLLLTLQINALKSLAAHEVRAHPAAKIFPGTVPGDARAVSKTVSIDTRIPGWHSLGLYAASGATVKVTIPVSAVGQGIGVRIGAHSDTLWHLDKWQRAPEITRTFLLAATETKAANAFGGLIYITVPERSKLGAIKIEVSGAVEAPLFRLGQTTPAQWRDSVRHAPGPWAELASDKLVLTVPSRVVRELDDPTALMQFWDAGMDAIADLAAMPRTRARPERIVTDEQISAGYMHSGYPIMTFLDVEKLVVDLPRLRAGTWGHWHELGHNHQVGDWTFEGTGEVTTNLFSLYVNEKLSGLSFAKAHPALSAKNLDPVLQKYFDGGARFDDWKSNPFLALAMYEQLQRAFGWDAFKKVFAEYRTLTTEQRPKTDAEKRDQWLVRFSRTVGRNLAPFFQKWGVPTSSAARASIQNLPLWMPQYLAPPVSVP